MAQNIAIEAQKPAKRYTRADFAALRYRLNGLALEGILTRLFTEDDLDARGISSAADLNAWLKDLLAVLIERAKKANPLVAGHLENAQKFNRWPAQVVNFLFTAGEQDYSLPRPDDTLTEWFKPVVVNALKAEGIDTLGGLKRYIEARGAAWHMAVPRIGAGKAQTLERWLRKNEATMGPIAMPRPPAVVTSQLELDPSTAIIPLERVARVASSLDGSHGINRNQTHCLISARNDLGAIHAYLMRYQDREATRRSYQKELERFLLWCIKQRGVAMSSVLAEDCEAYKAFLNDPAPAWTGKRAQRLSTAWRPFLGPLDPRSQRYSVHVLRTFFQWLVNVRYLGGNPWAVVIDPAVEEKETALDIDKAVPLNLWLRLVQIDGLLDRICQAHAPSDRAGIARTGREQAAVGAQYRLARAAILLIGFTGLRREEAVTAGRHKLKLVTDLPPDAPQLWELSILGKRKKWRTVFLPERAVAALRAHWLDRGHDFEGGSELRLLSPVTLGGTASRKKHLAEDGTSLTGAGFTPHGLYQLVRSLVTRMAADESLPLSGEDRATLVRLAPHALRHTFATQAARKMPPDVLQKLLGHASLATTTIYVRAERGRAIAEYAKYVDIPLAY